MIPNNNDVLSFLNSGVSTNNSPQNTNPGPLNSNGNISSISGVMGNTTPNMSAMPLVNLNSMMRTTPNASTNHAIGSGGWNTSFSSQPNFNILKSLGIM